MHLPLAKVARAFRWQVGERLVDVTHDRAFERDAHDICAGSDDEMRLPKVEEKRLVGQRVQERDVACARRQPRTPRPAQTTTVLANAMDASRINGAALEPSPRAYQCRR